MKKKIFICSMLMSLVAVPLFSISIDANEVETQLIETRKDDIRYRYKIENGKTYKRLYNYSKQVWVGDWILC